MTRATAPTIVPAQDVRVGDDLVFLGKPHRITSIEDYRHPESDETWRMAADPYGWTYTLIPGERVEVVR